jgi:hypothetical protein
MLICQTVKRLREPEKDLCQIVACDMITGLPPFYIGTRLERSTLAVIPLIPPGHTIRSKLCTFC